MKELLKEYSSSEEKNKSFSEYAIYLRKSRADMEAEKKGEGETLSRHEHILLDLADKNNYKIGKIYKEIVSGETIEARPQMQELLSEVKKGRWVGVLVVELERLARGETIDQGIVAKAFRISNTKIITPVKTYDPNNEFDEEYFEFGLFMSRREYKVINRRLQRGRMLSVKEGKYVGSVSPFGYDKVKIKGDKGYTLKKNSESNVVKTIFNLYAYSDFSIYEIVQKLNEMGIKPRKSIEWSTSSIREILLNPVYIGKIKWNARKEIISYKNDKLIKSRPRNSNYILVNGIHEPIIDEKTWKIVLSKKGILNNPVAHRNLMQNSLAGLIICAKCGKKMQRKTFTKNGLPPIIYCTNPTCDNISSKFCYVEEKIIQSLNVWFNKCNIDYREYIKKINDNKINSMLKMIIALEQKIKRENIKKMNIYDFFEEGIYTKEIFEKRKKEVLDKIEKINKSILELKKELEKEKLKLEEKFFIPDFKCFGDIYDFLRTPEDKNTLLKLVVSQVVYLKNEKSIKKDSEPTNFILRIFPKINKANDN